MYTGFKVNTSISKSNVSGLNESQLESLQRQVDTYTRKLELEKRKYFAVQDQYKAVTEEYTAEKSKLNLLKKQNSKAQSIILQTKIKSLQITLDKAVSAYDDTIAYNNRLKGEIDMLRRQKKNYQEMQRILEEQLKKVNEQTDHKIESLNRKKEKVEELKQEALHIKNTNAQEREQTIQKFQDLEKQYLRNLGSGELSSSKLKSSELLSPSCSGKPEMIDTQPLLKLRLKKILASNKEKLRLIDNYKKHMVSIEQAFKEIKEKSNISDLNEITATFIKSEEQNQSLYNYMDSLAQEIDRYDEENRDLQNKIRAKTNSSAHLTDSSSKNQLSSQIFLEQNSLHKASDPEQALKENQKNAEALKTLVSKIKNSLESALTELSTCNIMPHSSQKNGKNSFSAEDMTINITQLNIKDYLAKLEEHINNLLEAKQQAPRQTTNFIKENATTYSKPMPNSTYEELKEKEKTEKDDKKEESRLLNDRNLSVHTLSKQTETSDPKKNK